jgi:hypothetical protein
LTVAKSHLLKDYDPEMNGALTSVTGLSKIGLPHLSENMDAEDARAIRNYLYQMQEQLQYVLCNLDVENMSEPLRARLNSIQ